ncbi:MAG: Gfo/Idh/MocA family protein, partial [Nevskiales bacterium]
QALLDDPAVDAVYIPLPNSLHCEWTLKALAAGKHVLCEKVFASNAAEAQEMDAAARRAGRVLMEAIHYQYHPIAARMQDAVRQLGKIHSIAATMCVPVLYPRDIRYRLDLAGGATMDVGAYTVSLLHLLAAAAQNPALASPAAVVRAEALLRGPAIDRAMRVDLQWADGTTARLHHSLCSMSLLNMSARVVGERGELKLINPYCPHIWNRFSLQVDGRRQVERIAGETSYTCQLREFLRRIEHSVPTELSSSIRTLETIDAIYQKAGLPLRGLKNVPDLR